MAQYFTGKGYGISGQTDLNGRPFLTFQGPDDKIPVTLYDRVAQTFDFTIPQKLTPGAAKNERLDSATSSAIKSILGGGSDDELDHKISLELGGSNSPANLWIQSGITAGASAASDTLENNLALDVVNGKISLEYAWGVISEQKGFLLGEKMVIPSSLNQTVFGTVAKSVAGTSFSGPNSLPNPFSTLSFHDPNIFHANKPAVSVSPVNQQLKGQLDADIAALKSNPLNQPLLTKVFREQVALTAQQLQISNHDAGKVVSSYLVGYAQNKGIDAKGMMAAMNADIQKIVASSVTDPNIFGISSVTITKIVALLQVGSTVLVGAGVALAVIGIFLAGPAAVLGALSGGLLESIGAIFGVSAITGIGLTSFAVGEAFNVAAIGLNMSVKSTYDNGYLLPTQQISALKDALAIQKGLAGFLPSEQTTPSSVSTGGGGVASGSGSKLPPTLFVGHIDAGSLKAVAPFQPAVFHDINSAQDLADAAQHTLAAYLAGIANVFSYVITHKPKVVLPDGTELVGSTVLVQKGVTKKGKPTYRKVHNKFAVADIYAQTSAKGRIHLEELILGPINEAKYAPTDSQLADLGNTLDKKLITDNLSTVSSISLVPPTPATATPTSPTAAPGSSPTLPILAKLKAYGITLGYFNGVLSLYEKDGPGVMHGARQILTPDDLLKTYNIDKTQLVNVGGDVDKLLAQGYNFDTSKANIDTAGFTQLIANYDHNFLANNPGATVPGATPAGLAGTKRPYVSFAGSPDVFDRQTGKYISSTEAGRINLNEANQVEQIPTPRPEVKTGTDFALWAQKDLTNFPI